MSNIVQQRWDEAIMEPRTLPSRVTSRGEPLSDWERGGIIINALFHRTSCGLRGSKDKLSLPASCRHHCGRKKFGNAVTHLPQVGLALRQESRRLFFIFIVSIFFFCEDFISFGHWRADVEKYFTMSVWQPCSVVDPSCVRRRKVN